MRQVIAYHPEILVVRGEEVFSLHVDLDDWYSEGEVLEKLAGLTGVSTIGEAVVAVGERRFPGVDKNILSARISKVGPENVVGAMEEGRPVMQWGDSLAGAGGKKV